MRMLTPDPGTDPAGNEILRIEAFAELMYGTQLVCAGILQGRGDTLVSSTLMLGEPVAGTGAPFHAAHPPAGTGGRLAGHEHRAERTGHPVSAPFPVFQTLIFTMVRSSVPLQTTESL